MTLRANWQDGENVTAAAFNELCAALIALTAGGTLGPGSVTLANLVSGVQATLAKADTALQSVPANSVGSGQITDGSVAFADLAAAVQASLAKADTALQTIANNAIGSSQIADGTVSLADLTTALQNSVALANTALQTIASGSVGSTQIADGGVALVDLASGVQTSLALAATALQSVPTDSVGTAQIADGTVGLVDLTTAVQAAIALAGTAVQPSVMQAAVDAAKPETAPGVVRSVMYQVPTAANADFNFPARVRGWDPTRRKCVIRNVGANPFVIGYGSGDSSNFSSPGGGVFLAAQTVPVGSEWVDCTERPIFIRPVSADADLIARVETELGVI